MLFDITQDEYQTFFSNWFRIYFRQKMSSKNCRDDMYKVGSISSWFICVSVVNSCSLVGRYLLWWICETVKTDTHSVRLFRIYMSKMSIFFTVQWEECELNVVNLVGIWRPSLGCVCRSGMLKRNMCLNVVKVQT